MKELFKLFLSIPLVMLLKIIRLFVTVRIFEIKSPRIGHFVMDSIHFYHYLKKNKKKNEFIFFWFKEPTCNSYWAQYLKRNLPVFQFLEFVYRVDNKIFGQDQMVNKILNQSRDIYGHYADLQMSLKFTNEEEIFAHNWLKSHGWTEGQPIICLHVRDSKYLETGSEQTNSRDYSYHDYRDSPIDIYKKGVEYLIENKAFVIRTGKAANKELEIVDKNFLDYPFVSNQNDFIDVWIFANCQLCISTMSGPDNISDVFCRNLLFINHLPLSDFYAWSNAVHAPKILKNEDHHILNFEEYIKNSFHTKDSFIKNNISIENIQSKDIVEIFKEVWPRKKAFQDQFPSWNSNKTRFYNASTYLSEYRVNFKDHFDFQNPNAVMSEYWLQNINKSFFN